MTDFVHMDIFFIVTTVAVVILTLLVAVILWYGIRVIRACAHIAEQISRESDAIRVDLDHVREAFRRGTGRVRALARLFRTSLFR